MTRLIRSHSFRSATARARPGGNNRPDRRERGTHGEHHPSRDPAGASAPTTHLWAPPPPTEQDRRADARDEWLNRIYFARAY